MSDSKGDTPFDEVRKRVDQVIQDVAGGKVIRPQREELKKALDRAGTGDKVHDAIGRSR